MTAVVSVVGNGSIPEKTTALPQVTDNLLTYPSWDSNSDNDERQGEVSGNGPDNLLRGQATLCIKGDDLNI